MVRAFLFGKRSWVELGPAACSVDGFPDLLPPAGAPPRPVLIVTTPPDKPADKLADGLFDSHPAQDRTSPFSGGLSGHDDGGGVFSAA